MSYLVLYQFSSLIHCPHLIVKVSVTLNNLQVVKLHQKLGKPIPSPDPVVVSTGSTSTVGGVNTKTTTTAANNSTGVKTAASTGTTQSTNAPIASGGANSQSVLDLKKDELKDELVELKEKEVEPVGQEYIEEIKNDEGEYISRCWISKIIVF